MLSSWPRGALSSRLCGGGGLGISGRLSGLGGGSGGRLGSGRLCGGTGGRLSSSRLGGGSCDRLSNGRLGGGGLGGGVGSGHGSGGGGVGGDDELGDRRRSIGGGVRLSCRHGRRSLWPEGWCRWPECRAAQLPPSGGAVRAPPLLVCRQPRLPYPLLLLRLAPHVYADLGAEAPQPGCGREHCLR